MKQSIDGDSGDQSGISDIRRMEIWIEWNEKKCPMQIAEETHKSVQEVYQALKQMQKTLTKQIGVNHVRKRKR
jgi:hypothetical protein